VSVKKAARLRQGYGGQAPAPVARVKARSAADSAAGVTFFKTPADLRKWFAKHHATAEVLWVGFYKKASGEPSITWPESVDEALGVGWIDGIRKSIDATRYKIRFTPRRRGSIWSAVNVARVAALEQEQRMQPAGRAAFADRRENRSGIYAYEQRPVDLPEPYSTLLKRHASAHAFFMAQPPSYRKLATWWVVSAKKDETRAARVAKLIEVCLAGKRL
jgi:uncharacterized protein YdeI (YjbR/CyaY-like superfamily)